MIRHIEMNAVFIYFFRFFSILITTMSGINRKNLYFTREFVHSTEVVAVFFHIGANALNVL